jgi:hypothetical protein
MRIPVRIKKFKGISLRNGGVGMTRLRLNETRTYLRCIVHFVLAAIIVLSAGCSKSEQGITGPKTFASPEEASKAIYDAAKSGDSNALIAIFGTDATDLIISGDPVQDKSGRDKFVANYDEMHRWGKLTDGGKVLNIGADNYPLPFPLMKDPSGQWYFDSRSAKEEILARRIGGNELATIDTLNAMADAQTEYFSQAHDGSKVHQYAQKFVSDEGKQNGLYWKVAGDQPESPLGPLAANASAEGYGGNAQARQPFHGYFYRIITKQGEHAHGGVKNYIVNGNMTGGFAFLAYPADYRNSGVMTLIINQDRVVFQKDLGEKTSDLAKAMTEFNPDDTWKIVE